MSALGSWWRWRRELAGLRREASAAYDRWMRANYAYQDIAVVMADQPGAWFDGGPCSKALEEVLELSDQYRALRAQVERMERTRPAWTTW